MRSVQVFEGDGVDQKVVHSRRYIPRTWYPPSVRIESGVRMISIRAGTDDPDGEQRWWLPLVGSLVMLDVVPKDGGPFGIKGRVVSFVRDKKAVTVNVRIHK